MPAAKKNLVHDMGTTFNLKVRKLDSNKQPVNLTGHTVLFQLFEIGNKTPVFTKPATVGADGWINIKVTDEETATWDLGKYAYQVNQTDTEGDVYRLFYGALDTKSGVDV